MVTTARALRALCPLFAAPLAAAQLPALHHVVGAAPGDYFGYAVSPAGDADGDGVPDFMVGAHQNLNGGHSPDPGYARIFSGADGSELRTLHGDGTNWLDGPDDHFGHSLDVVGDLDGDGIDELVVGAFKDDNVDQNCGLARLFDGASGVVLQQHDGDVNGDRLGVCVAGVPDADGDGLRDYVVGVYKDDNTFFNAGSTRLYSSGTGALLLELDGPSVGAAFGWSCRPAGDVDGDGVGDFVSGAPQWGAGSSFRGYAAVHSGADGGLLHEWFGTADLDRLGHAVDGAGDVDADGYDDVIVGAIQTDLAGDGAGAGYARVYSGLDGSVLHEFTGGAFFDQLGWSVRGVGDVTGDGHADLLVGAPQGLSLGLMATGQPGYARLYSGRDGALMHTFVGLGPDDQLGAAVARLDDLDGDGSPEFLLGASQDVAGQTRPGYARVIAGGLLLTVRFCVAAPNSAGAGARLDHSGTLSVARDDFALRVDGCPPEHFGLFFQGTDALLQPFGDGFRCVGGSTHRLAVVNTGAAGAASLALDLAHPPTPGAAILPGATWRFQFWYRDIPAAQSGFNTSDALEGTFAP